LKAKKQVIFGFGIFSNMTKKTFKQTEIAVSIISGLRGRGSPLLAIEINPVDSSGSATKKRGIVIRSGSELEEISRLLTNPKITQLAKSIDEVNPDVKTSAKGVIRAL
jgi:hypothetical protein